MGGVAERAVFMFGDQENTQSLGTRTYSRCLEISTRGRNMSGFSSVLAFIGLSLVRYFPFPLLFDPVPVTHPILNPAQDTPMYAHIAFAFVPIEDPNPVHGRRHSVIKRISG
jgi:hypothetical protein